MKWMSGVVALTCGCGSVQDNPPDAAISGDAAGDAADTDAAPPRCDPSKPFGTPVPLTELNGGGGQQLHPTLTADELTIVFTNFSDLYVATRTSRMEPFGAPALLAGVNAATLEHRASLTGDGLVLYVETHPGGSSAGEWNLGVASRTSTSTSFGAHAPVAALNTASDEHHPFVLPDHSAIYFVSNRNNVSGGELFRAARVGGSFEAPALVTGIDLQLPGSKEGPTLTPDELVLYFSSDRANGNGGYNDIYMATRSSAVTGFGAPVLVPELNSAFMDVAGWVSADNCVIYLSRSAGTTSQVYDLYVATKPL